MSTRRPIARSALIALVFGIAFLVVGIGLMVAAFPNQTDDQNLLSDAAWLPFALAVGAPIVQMTWESKALQLGGRLVLGIFAAAALAVVTGLIMYVTGLTIGPRSLVATASTVAFAGLGVAFCYLAWKALRRERPSR